MCRSIACIKKTMLTRKDIVRLIGDEIRTELASRQVDVWAAFDAETEKLWAQIPAEIRPDIEAKLATVFGYMARPFSSFERLVDYAYASFLKNQQIDFFTTDSTGAVCTRAYTVHQMWEEARTLASLFPPIKRVVSFVPANQAYGFSCTVLLPQALQVPVVTLPALPAQNWQARLQSGDLLVGFPLFWNYWLRAANRLPEGVEAVSSSVCPDETIVGLLQAGAVRFTELYGSEDTGVIAVRHAAGEPFGILPCWDISRKEKEPLIKRQNQTDWYPLPDYVSMQDERSFFPLSRQDGAVLVAGRVVYPKHVEEVMSSYPAVKFCRVRLMRPDEGERLKAFVVLKENFGAECLSDMRAYLAARLTAVELPRTFTFGEMLPYTSVGKESDW